MSNDCTSFPVETCVWELLLHSGQPGLPVAREGKSLLWCQWYGYSLQPPPHQRHSRGREVWPGMQQTGPVPGAHCHCSVSHLHPAGALCHHHCEASHLLVYTSCISCRSDHFKIIILVSLILNLPEILVRLKLVSRLGPTVLCKYPSPPPPRWICRISNKPPPHFCP